MYTLFAFSFRCLDTHGRFSLILNKGDNFFDFLFALLHTKALLKRVLLKQERFFPQGLQFTVYRFLTLPGN